MRRRDLLTTAAASAAALTAPWIGRADKLNKLVSVPPEDLSVLDPVVTGLRSTRNQAYLVCAFTTRSRSWGATSSPASAALPRASALPMR
jgi:hypothetical protein